MINSAPVMLAARGEARKATRLATSSASVTRLVEILMFRGMMSSRAVWALTPEPAATTSANPPGSVQNGVRTGPGVMALMRTPRGANSSERALVKLVSAALAAEWSTTIGNGGRALIELTLTISPWANE